MSQRLNHNGLKTHRKPHSNGGKIFDKAMYVISLIGPIMTFPQVYDVWSTHQKASVSLTTWGAYTAASALWITYGIVHKEKLLVFVNFLMLLLDSAVVIGLLFH